MGNRRSLGIIEIGSTPERITRNLSDPTARLSVHAVSVQAFKDNAGKGALGDSDMDVTKTTEGLNGVYLWIPKPSATDDTSLPSFSFSNAFAPNAFNAAEVYIHGTSGDKFQVFVITS